MPAPMGISSQEANDDDDWGEAEEEVIVLSTNPMDFVQNGVARGTHGLDWGSRRSDLLVASLANLAISYNVVNAGLAIKIIQKGGLHTISGAEESLISSGAVLGMVAGQTFFGVVGDNIDRNRALTYSLLLCFIGAAACALSVDIGWGLDIQSQLIWWRIILGVGAGGVYPLAATLARASGVDWAWLRKQRAKIHGEGSAAAEDNDTGSTAVAFMFSMQGVGHLAAYVVGWVLLAIFPDRPVLTWRLHLGVGAVPPLIVVLMQAAYGNARYVALEEPAQGSPATTGPSVGVAGTAGAETHRGEEDMANLGLLHVLRSRLFGPDQLWIKLIGTAGSWFLFDVTFYGNQLYQEDVLVSVFGKHSTVTDVARQDSIVALVALPGYFVSIVCIDWLGPRFVQLQGFVGMALTFGVIALSFDSLVRDHDYILMLLYSFTFLFSNFGPNSTTFMLPALTFPDEVRSTLNGFSAAAGKLGAVVGSLLFVPASRVYGVAAVLLMCAGVSLAGWLLTLIFVQPGPQKARGSNGATSGEGGGSSGNMIPLEAIVGMNGRGSNGSGWPRVTPQERLPFVQGLAEGATRNGTCTTRRETSAQKGGDALPGSQGGVLNGDGSDWGLGQAFGVGAGDAAGYASAGIPFGRGRDVEGAAEIPPAGGEYSLEDEDEEYDGAAGSMGTRPEDGAPGSALV